jgi:hypothetical protein
MSDQQTRRLHLRGFISLLTALSFLIMTVSGVILFITPQGRIAYWLDWTFLGISKTQWGDMHITTSLLFALAGLWHTWLNWRALVSYFQDKASKALALKAELAVATVITVFCTIGGIYKTPPLSYILDFNAYFQESWIKTPEDEPVISHAELMPLKQFLQKVDIELEPALAELSKQGIKVDGPDQKLLDISRKNGKSPAHIYKLLKTLEGEKTPVAAATSAVVKPQQVAGQPPTVTGTAKTAQPPKAQQVWTAELVQQQFEGKGVGRKTLADLCQEFHLDLAVISSKLAAKGIKMKSGDSLKKVSDERGELPIEILKVILVGEKK